MSIRSWRIERHASWTNGRRSDGVLSLIVSRFRNAASQATSFSRSGGTPKYSRLAAVAAQVDAEVERLLLVADGLDHQIRHRAARQLAHGLDRIDAARGNRIGRAEQTAARRAFLAHVDADDAARAQPRQAQIEQQADRPLADDGDGLADDAGHAAERGEHRRHRLREDGLVVGELRSTRTSRSSPIVRCS